MACRSSPPIPPTRRSCSTGTSKATTSFKSAKPCRSCARSAAATRRSPSSSSLTAPWSPSCRSRSSARCTNTSTSSAIPPAFIANRVDFAVERYHESLLPPYFRVLKKYTDEGAYSWDAPGHMGGVAFLKHPVGMEFHKFFGENLMRSGPRNLDRPASVRGSTTSAPPERANATPPASSAPTGPSTSSAAPRLRTRSSATASSPRTISSLADANCHKSICHSLTVTGARPVYFKPTRNRLRHDRPRATQAILPPRTFAASSTARPSPPAQPRRIPPTPSSPTPPTTASATTSTASSKSFQSPSPASTSTKPGTPTPSSTPSTADASPWMSPDDMPDRPAILRRPVHP